MTVLSTSAEGKSLLADLEAGRRELFCQMSLREPKTGKLGELLVLRAVPRTRRVGGITLSPKWGSDSVLMVGGADGD